MAEDIEWVEVDSSNVEKWRYAPEEKVLDIKFITSDDIYSYDEVPQDVADGLKSTPSIGQYHRNFIKDRYRFYKS